MEIIEDDKEISNGQRERVEESRHTKGVWKVWCKYSAWNERMSIVLLRLQLKLIFHFLLKDIRKKKKVDSFTICCYDSLLRILRGNVILAYCRDFYNDKI